MGVYNENENPKVKENDVLLHKKKTNKQILFDLPSLINLRFQPDYTFRQNENVYIPFHLLLTNIHFESQGITEMVVDVFVQVTHYLLS